MPGRQLFQPRSCAPAPRIEPISETLRVLRMTVGSEFVADLKSVRAALSHKIPDGNLEKVLHACIRRMLLDCERRSKDLGRSLDYLGTRKEIDQSRIAYLGNSWGASVAPVMLAVEDRFKVAVLLAGGFLFGWTLPEVDATNFVGRARIPLLMLNGRYDDIFPVETSQRPLLELFGAPAEQKKHILYETGHTPPREDVIRESLRWLDTYLGPVGS